MMIQGGWTEFHSVTDEEKKLFEKAMTLAGVNYEPFAVSTQVVSGTNYKFLCNATTVTQTPHLSLAQVIVYAPVDGDPTITHISELD